jgi:hypothetical protein
MTMSQTLMTGCVVVSMSAFLSLLLTGKAGNNLGTVSYFDFRFRIASERILAQEMEMKRSSAKRALTHGSNKIAQISRSRNCMALAYRPVKLYESERDALCRKYDN